MFDFLFYKFSHEILEYNTTSLTSFNDFSHIKYEEFSKKLDSHSKCIKEMKVDLEYIFKKLRYITILAICYTLSDNSLKWFNVIRLLKTKVSTQYPDAYAEVEKRFPKHNNNNVDE